MIVLHVILLVGATVGLSVLSADPACAQVLTNRDDVARGVTVIAKSVRRRIDVEPGKAIADFCVDGCVIRLDEDENRDFLIEGNERLSIENGLVYFDGEVVETDRAKADGTSSAGESPSSKSD